MKWASSVINAHLNPKMSLTVHTLYLSTEARSFFAMNFLRCVTVASELQRMYLRFSPTSSADFDGLAAVAVFVVDVEEEGTGEEDTAEDSLHSSKRLTSSSKRWKSMLVLASGVILSSLAASSLSSAI